MKKHIFNSYKGITIMVWIVIAIILWSQIYHNTSLVEALLITPCIFLVIFLTNTVLDDFLLPKAMRKKRMGFFWGQFVFLTMVMASFMALVLLGFRHLENIGIFPHSHLFSETDTFWADFQNQVPASLIINLALVGIRFYHEHVKLEKVHLESQLQALRSQITPHFMFNVLNHIHYYIEKKDDLASTLLMKYSDILRYQLYSGKKDTVRLEEEIQFLKNFIDIEELRWEDKVDVNCSWEIEDSQKTITPLILIPLIENAFKHVSRASNEKGYINIAFEQKQSMIRLEVENSKSVLLNKKKEDSGLGIENLKNRLDILYPDKHKLSINETDSVYGSELVIKT